MDSYFAAAPTEEAGKRIFEKIENFYREVDTLGYFNVVSRSHQAYFGSTGEAANGKLYNSHSIRRDGEQGEAYTFKVNMYRNLLQHLLVMTTAERPALETQAANTDAKSLAQAELGDSLLDYYMVERRVERYMVNATEYGIVYAGGHIGVFWDTDKGRQYGEDPETGRVRYDGDLDFRVYSPLDVVLDIYKSSHEHVWKCARNWVNKYDLASQIPEKADEILGQRTKDQNLDRFSFAMRNHRGESDDIAVYDFYHDKTPSVPEGRMVSLIDGGTVLFDGPLPYKKVPIYSILPSRIADTPFGYSTSFDLLSVQEAYDILHSVVLTNQATFGTQLIGLPKGSDINYQDLAKGLACLEFDPALGPPQPIQLTATPGEIFNYINSLDGLGEKLSGLNSIVRGQPQGQLTGASGSAMALLAATAQQFNQGLQREYEMLIEDVGTAIIQTLQMYAHTKRVALISGQSKRSRLKEFSATDIDDLERVRVKRTGALGKTTAGRLDIAKELLNAGMVKNPQQYAEAIKTGTIEPIFESEMSRSLLIRRENEKMRDGELPLVLRTDNHEQHIQEHLNLLDDPDIRASSDITGVVLAHIEEHESYLQPPMPQDGQMQGPPPPEGSPTMDVPEGQLQEAQPSMPNMPNLPQGTPEEMAQGLDNVEPPVLDAPKLGM